MLRFNVGNLNGYKFKYTFQYILCCGSTIFWKSITHHLNYFNTSYVAVQQDNYWLYK